MLPKSQRLNLKKDFKFVVSGKRVETPNLKVYIKTAPNLETKAAVSISSKNFKSSVERNKAKRIVFRQLKELFSDLPRKINLIIMPKSGIFDVRETEILKEIKDAVFGN